MAFGIKIKKIKFKKAYTIENLFEAIKDVAFEAGKPAMVTYMGSVSIVFPPINSQNQVQIMRSGLFKKETNSFIVQKGPELSMKGATKNLVMDTVTDGWSNLGNNIGDAVKESERLVDVTFDELSKIDL